MRVAAAGDIHVDRHNRDEVARSFAALNGQADLVLIAGDMTTHGEPEQAELFVSCRRETELPVVAVLGNHDFEAGKQDEVADVLRDAGVTVLDGDACEVRGIRIGGAKGFIGGFGRGTLEPWGEDGVKMLVLVEMFLAEGRLAV